MVMITYKKLSTLLIITCLMYMCFVSLLQLSLQNERYQEKLEYIETLKPNGNGGKDLHEGTSGSQFDGEHDVRDSVSASEPEPDLFYQYRNNDDQSSWSSEKEDNSPPFMLRKLKEKKGQQPTASSDYGIKSKEDETAASFSMVNDFSGVSKVAETNVTFQPVGQDFYVYGAYLDSRFPPYTYARIFSLRQILNQTDRLVCQFKDFDNRSINIVAQTYEMCENHGKKFGGWVYSCLIPTTVRTQPRNISLIVTNGTGLQKSTVFTVPLQRLKQEGDPTAEANQSKGFKPIGHYENILNSQDSKRQDFSNSENIAKDTTKHTIPEHQDTPQSETAKFRIGVCVPPLYGNIYLPKLINFIEMCRLLGADQIFLYTHDISQEITMFLRQYHTDNSKILSLINWDIPVISKSSSFSLPTSSSSLNNQIIWNHGQLLAVQHCLYSNMAEYDWLLFIDTDEILIPQTADTWRDLITETIDEYSSKVQPDSIAGISFESAFFQQDFQTQVTNSIDYFQYLHRTKDTSAYRSKLFVRPSKVFELGIHHLSKSISEQLRVIKATPSLGLLHHYRKCVTDDNGDEVQCEILVKDETILKYEVPLTIASRRVFNHAMRFFANQR